MAAPYYGWYVVAACATIACFSWGFAFYGLGVYLHVLVRLYGWPTGLISVAVTAYYLIGAVLIIAVGRLIDRHGPRGVLAYGIFAMAGALALLGQITAGGPRVRPRSDRADPGYARELSARPLGPGRLGSSRHRRRALGAGAARGPRASTCGVIAAHRGAAHHEA